MKKKMKKEKYHEGTMTNDLIIVNVKDILDRASRAGNDANYGIMKQNIDRAIAYLGCIDITKK